MPTLKITYVPVRELNPFPRNPRRIGQTEMERLRCSIRQFGLVDPLIVRREDNVLIGGHQRLEAARLEKIEMVPVVYLEGLSEQKTTLLNVALNNTRLQGEFDEVKLAELLQGIESVDATLSGFDQIELKDLCKQLEDFQPQPAESADRLDRKKTIVCPECGYEIAA